MRRAPGAIGASLVALALASIGCGTDDTRDDDALDAPAAAIQGNVSAVPAAPRLGLAQPINPPAALAAALAAGRPTDVLVRVEPTGVDAPGLGARSRVLAALGNVHVLHRYSALPYVAVRMTSLSQLHAAATQPETRAIYENTRYEKSLTHSLPLIHADVAAAGGDTGAGTTVAVIDTGVDYTRAAFGSCASAGGPGCRVVFSADIASDDGALDDDGHGTNVSAIIAGVAPGARLFVLDVFGADGSAYASDILAAIDLVLQKRADLNIVALNLSLGAGAFRSACARDVFAPAVASARSAGVHVVAAAGNDGYADELASPACAPGAISVGAVYARDYTGIQYSTCTDMPAKADSVACFSNSASMLTLLAPGSIITAGGYSMAGTSQASPHVAGALAVLRAAFPNETVDQIEARLQQSATMITDPRNGLSRPRLDLTAALAGCRAQVSPTSLSLPVGGGSANVTIKTGSACAWSLTGLPAWMAASAGAGTGDGILTLQALPNAGDTRAANVVVGGVTISVTQGGVVPTSVGLALAGGAKAVTSPRVELVWQGVSTASLNAVCVSFDATCHDWRAPSAAPMPVTLSGADGTTRIYGWVQLVDRRVLGPTYVDVILDRTPPSDGDANVVRSGARATVSWASFADGTSGVAGYRLIRGLVAPLSCADGITVYEGSATSAAFTDLEPTTTYIYRLCAHDAAGNWSQGFNLWAPPQLPLGEPR